MPAFMTERFLGVFLEVSDDRTLTNLTPQAGLPDRLPVDQPGLHRRPAAAAKLAKQQLRWARGSQYNTLRMLPWMLGTRRCWRSSSSADIVLPFLLLGRRRRLGLSGRDQRRGDQLLRRRPVRLRPRAGLRVRGRPDDRRDWLSMCAAADPPPRRGAASTSSGCRCSSSFSTFFLMPIRLFGFFRMAHVRRLGRTPARRRRCPRGERVHGGAGHRPPAAPALRRAPACPAGHALPAHAPPRPTLRPARRASPRRASEPEGRLPVRDRLRPASLEALAYVAVDHILVVHRQASLRRGRTRPAALGVVLSSTARPRGGHASRGPDRHGGRARRPRRRGAVGRARPSSTEAGGTPQRQAGAHRRRRPAGEGRRTQGPARGS